MAWDKQNTAEPLLQTCDTFAATSMDTSFRIRADILCDKL